LIQIMQELIMIHKKERRQRTEDDERLKQTLENLKTGKVKEMNFKPKKVKSDFPKTEKEVFDSLNRALDDVRKGRTRRVF